MDQVYWPLARSNGKVLELARARKANSDDRDRYLHQFLSEIGVKALRTHLGRLLGMAEVSQTKEEYEGHVNRIFGNQMTLDIKPKPSATVQSQSATQTNDGNRALITNTPESLANRCLPQRKW